MSVNTVKFRYACVCLIALISIACSSVPLTKEPTLMPDAERPSPSLTALLEPTLDNLEEEQTEQPQPTVHILGEPAIAPTVDVNTMNINLKTSQKTHDYIPIFKNYPNGTHPFMKRFQRSAEEEKEDPSYYLMVD